MTARSAARVGLAVGLTVALLGCPPVDGPGLTLDAVVDTAEVAPEDGLDFDYLPEQDTAPQEDRCRIVYQISTRWEGDSGYQAFVNVDYRGKALQAWVVKLVFPVVTAISGAWTSNGIFVGEPANQGTEVSVAFRPPDYIGLLGPDFTRYQFTANVFGNPNVAVPYLVYLNDVECELVISNEPPEE